MADKEEHSVFEKESGSQRTGIMIEFWDFLKYNKKWWLLPILVLLALLSALIIIGGSAAGPFIYTLF